MPRHIAHLHEYVSARRCGIQLNHSQKFRSLLTPNLFFLPSIGPPKGAIEGRRKVYTPLQQQSHVFSGCSDARPACCTSLRCRGALRRRMWTR